MSLFSHSKNGKGLKSGIPSVSSRSVCSKKVRIASLILHYNTNDIVQADWNLVIFAKPGTTPFFCFRRFFSGPLVGNLYPYAYINIKYT